MKVHNIFMDFGSFKFIILLVILAIIIYFILMGIKGVDTCKREIEKTHGDITNVIEEGFRTIKSRFTSEISTVVADKMRQNCYSLISLIRDATFFGESDLGIKPVLLY